MPAPAEPARRWLLGLHCWGAAAHLVVRKVLLVGRELAVGPEAVRHGPGSVAPRGMAAPDPTALAIIPSSSSA